METSTQGWIEAVRQEFDDYAGDFDACSRDFLLRIMELSEFETMPKPTVWATRDGILRVIWRFAHPKGHRWIAIDTPGDGSMYYMLVGGKGDGQRKKCRDRNVDGFRMLVGWARGEEDR